MADADNLTTITVRLRKALQTLAQNQGIERENILDLLDSDKMQILRDAWSVRRENGTEAARQAIRAKLVSILSQLTPPERAPRESERLSDAHRVTQFRRVILALFNVLPSIEHANQMSLGDRYEWLQNGSDNVVKDKTRADLRINKAAARRDFEYAIDKIAEDIATRWPTLDDDEPGPLPPLISKRKPKKHRPLVLIAACVLAAAAGITVPVILSYTGDSGAGGQAKKYITVGNSPVEFKTGQTSSPDLVIPHPLAEIERPPPYDGVNLADFDAWKTKYKAVRANTVHVTFVARPATSANRLPLWMPMSMSYGVSLHWLAPG